MNPKTGRPDADPEKKGSVSTNESGQELGQSVEQLAEQYLECLRNGGEPDINEYIEQYPDLEDEIRDVFEAVAMMEDIAPDHREQQPVSQPAGAPTAVGEYRLVRELGRGGMGIVYEAEHATMRRRVALKVLHAAATKGKNDVQRFLREARSAGRLHHTNIVPVFEVGEDKGLHFYAMQCIRGQNLDLVITDLCRLQKLSDKTLRDEESLNDASAAQRLLSGEFEKTKLSQEDIEPVHDESTLRSTDARLPDAMLNPPKALTMSHVALPDSAELSNVGQGRDGYFHRVARIGLQIADALQYAHDHGVLHRDIKPSNLILDTSGTVWITDFGLARTADDNITRTGDIVGTLRYMAPEQMKGQADSRSDIYGLGLTLFELSTLRPAFGSSDNADLVQQITRSSVPRASGMNPAIPRDLETIIHKSIERSPADRYKSAKALAEDLRLFLSDRPIQARRTSLGEQAWRWGRRNPAMASLISSVAVLLLVIFAGALAFAFTSQRHANRLQEETDRAIEAESEMRLAHLESRRSLYVSFLGEASASRWSSRVGRHFQTIEIINRAAQLLPTLEFDEDRIRQERLRLRNEVIAALPLVDLRVKQQWANDQSRKRISLSKNGKLCAFANVTGGVSIVNLETNEEIRQLQGASPSTWALQFDPTSQFLCGLFSIPGNTVTVNLWEVATGRSVLTLKARRGLFDFRSDGKHLAFQAADDKIDFYEVETGRLIDSRKMMTRGTEFIRYSPSGDRIAVALGRRVHIHDLTEREREVVVIECTQPVYAMQWSPDGRIAVGAHNKTGLIQVFDPDNLAAEPRLLKGHRAEITTLDFSSDGRLIKSISWDGKQIIWDSYIGTRLLTVEASGNAFGGFTVDDASLPFVVTGSSIGIWEVATGDACKPTYTAAPSDCFSLKIHPHHPQIIAIVHRNQLEFWNTQTGRRIKRLSGKDYREAEFTKDGKWILISYHGNAALTRSTVEINETDGQLNLKIGDPQELLKLKRPIARAQRLSVDESGRRVAVTQSRDRVVIIDPDGEYPTVTLDKHAEVEHVAISPDGKLVATGTWHGQGLFLFDAETGKQLRELLPRSSGLQLDFSPDGKWLAASARDGQFIWDTESWTRREITSKEMDGNICNVDFSPDGSKLLVSQTRSIRRIVDVATLADIAVLETYDFERGIARFSSDGQQIVISTSYGYRTWDLQKIRSELTKLRLEWDQP